MRHDYPERQGGMFGLDVPQLIRFLYSGFLAIGLLQLTPIQADLNARLNSLGNVLSTFLIFGLGIVIWTVYHQVIGEGFWFQFIHAIHKKVHLLPIPLLKKLGNTSDMLLLEECGVPFGKRRIAYEMFRTSYPDLSREEKQWVELSHAYNQLLDITWIEIAVVLIWWRLEVDGWLFLAIVGAFSCLAVIYIDIRQHAIERHLMLKSGKDRFKEWLERSGLLGR